MPADAGEKATGSPQSPGRDAATRGAEKPPLQEAEALETIREAAQIPSHFAFIDEVLGRYPMRSERSEQFSGDLARLKQRYADPNVYLGVIGEFSAGKSTLINAFIDDELLRTDILQGTTSAATLLRYGAALDAEVLLSNGRQNKFSGRWGVAVSRLLAWLRTCFSRDPNRGPGMLMAWIHRYTSCEDKARQVAKVTIEHPAAALKNGLVIVDTPGLNAENQRHVAVTLKTIRDMCDAFIVALPATSPGSELLVAFLRTHLSGALHRCLFVITKVDLLRNPAEEERVRKNVRARLAAELPSSLPPTVFSCAPEIALNVLQGKDPNAGRTRAVPAESLRAISEQFETVRQHVLQDVRRHRFMLVLESIAASVSDLLARLERYLGECQRAYRTRHEALQKQRIPDLDKFIRQRKSVLSEAFRTQIASIYPEAEEWLATNKRQLLEVLRSAIFAAPDRRSLKRELSTVPQRLIGKLEELVELKYAELAGRVTRAACQQQEAFEAEFRKLYEMLATLGGELDVGPSRLGIIAAPGIQTVTAARTAAWHVTTQSLADGAKIGGGVIACGAAGAAIAGPLGAIVGAAGGALLGKFFGKSIDELRESSYDSVAAVIDENFQTIAAEFCRRLGTSAQKAEHELFAAIDAYGQHYAALVNDMIEQDRVERNRLATLHNQALHDRQELANRSRLLNQIREQCVAIQRDEATD